MKRVFITRMAQLSPLASQPEAFRRRLFAGDSSIEDLRGSVVDKDFPAPYGSVMKDLSMPPYLRDIGLTSGTRSAYGALWATGGLVAEAPLPALDGLVWAGADGMDFELTTASSSWSPKALEYFSESSAVARLVAGFASINSGPKVPEEEIVSINTGCSSGLVAFGEALARIRSGLWRRALVGGSSFRVSRYDLMSCYQLGMLADGPVAEGVCRPFDLHRNGLVRGEASAIFLLEAADALSSGAKPIAEVCGFGHANDAQHPTAGRADASTAARAVLGALENSGRRASEVDYVCAHGNGSRLFDRLETMALKEALGARAFEIPISSIKGQIGHCTYAAGSIAAYATVEMMVASRVSPTVGLIDRDPECDLDFVSGAGRPAHINFAILNAFGFGGQNASLVLRKV